MSKKDFTKENEQELAFINGRSWEYSQVARDLLKKSSESKDELSQEFYYYVAQSFIRINLLFDKFYLARKKRMQFDNVVSEEKNHD